MLGQLYDGQSSIENACILEAEFENLVQGEAFRSGFEDLAQEYGTSLPSKQLATVLQTLSHRKVPTKFPNTQSFALILHMLSLDASWMKA